VESHPAWWHPDGIQMMPGTVEKFMGEFYLTIRSNTASLTIKSTHKSGLWQVRWQVIHFLPDKQESSGMRLFDTADLANAFRLVGGPNPPKCKYPEYYTRYGLRLDGSDSAVPGKYTRADGDLNIPCPGTGCDGDPNISIWVHHAVSKAVMDLIVRADENSAQRLAICA